MLWLANILVIVLAVVLYAFFKEGGAMFALGFVLGGSAVQVVHKLRYGDWL